MSLDAFATVTQISAAIAAKRTSPIAVTETYLDRIAKLDPKYKSFVAVFGDEARLAAEAADKAIRAGHRIGPLHGVPIAVKDIVDIEGRITTGGCAAWRDRVSPVTATLVRLLYAQGMIVLGKTHTVEFAMGGWGTNTHMGTPWNPWDLKVHRTPGGSSSGTGVAVGAGLAPCGIGTDTGGSVRLPAAWDGIVGLKTTIGRISTYGVLPLSETLDTPGPMTRSVEDAAILFKAWQSVDPADPKTAWQPPSDPMPSLKRGVAGLKLGVLEAPDREGVDPEVLAAYDASIEQLARLGARPAKVTLPLRFKDAVELTSGVIAPECYRWVGHMVESNEALTDPDVRPRVLLGRKYSARDYLRNLDQRALVKKQFDAALAETDAFLTPTTVTSPIPINTIDQSTTPAFYTRLFNLLDRCALALPNGFTKAGLPISLQIACKAYDEAMALRVGWAYEQATEWHTRRPPAP
jgi:aspartyl-tRNA(Asn)/glutamyl-tRNA(Gln) amidotransferase subunit A